jgi:hypothetical protein
MKIYPITLLSVFLAARLAAQDSYSIAWSTIDGGGSVSASASQGKVALAGSTVGQPDAGSFTEPPGAFGFHGGFWAGASGSSAVDKTVIASDDFAYPDGPASGQAAGVGMWEGSWTGFGFRVTDGKLDGVSAIPANFNRLRRVFTNQESSPELFVSFDLTTPDTIGIGDFAVASLITIEFTYPASLVFGKWPGSNEFALGANQATTGVAIQPETTYHLVGAYDIDQGSWSLWVDPDGNDSYNPATGQGSADATLAGVLGIQPAYTLSLDTSKPGYVFDNLVISYGPGGAGLTPSSPPDPSPEDLAPEVRLDRGALILSWNDLGVPVVVEKSQDLSTWTPVDPQPAEPEFQAPLTDGHHFFRLSIVPR